jgi:geranylgeranyl transferase type-2 subunit beta
VINRCYLDELDELLAAGLQGIAPPVIQATVQSVLSSQQLDGGFRGRQGGSDLYYTDLALRSLLLLQPDHPAVRRAADYIVNCEPVAGKLIEQFNLINAARGLQRCGIASVVDLKHVAGHVLHQLVTDPHAERLGAYQIFLALLCLQTAQSEFAQAAQLLKTLSSLQRSDGGFSESTVGTQGQTSATAAVVAVLQMYGAVPPSTSATVARFLSGMQAADGGLKVHADASGGDLLSTFTGLLTLWGIESMARIDLTAIARFLRSCAGPAGGFRALARDPEVDVEYTWYGLGTMALLRLWGSVAEMLEPRR